jgi:hypothetical protein
MVALAAVVAIIPTAPAQQPRTGSFPDYSTYTLFHGDSVDVDRAVAARLAAAIRNVERPPGCPSGRIKIRVPQGDPRFQAALARARRDALLAGLGAPVAGRVFTETEIFGPPGGTDTVLEVARDTARPTLRATSRPTGGTLVQRGDTIRMTVLARDGDGRWETGVKAFRLIADSEGGRVIAAQSYQPCTEPKERRLEADYRVPDDPPPVVRLSAVAEDGAGNIIRGEITYPTKGDFYGTIEWFLHARNTSSDPTASQNEAKSRGRADITLAYDGRGNLTGAFTGSATMETNWWGYPLKPESGVCRLREPVSYPVSGSLTGSYMPGPETMRLNAATDVVANLTVSWERVSGTIVCPPGSSDFAAELARLFAYKLERGQDGAYRASHRTVHPAPNAHEFWFRLKLQKVIRPRP